MHHAYLIIGSADTASSLLPDGVLKDTADVRHIVVDRLGIGDARTLTQEAVRMPVNAPFRTFILQFASATVEAQNALLKSLEEPVPTSRFYIIVPREDVLMKTVRSRLMTLTPTSNQVAHFHEAEVFLHQSYAERLASIAEKAKTKDTAWMEGVLSGLEQHATSTKNQALLSALMTARTYFAGSGASKKMLLEHVALAIAK